MQDDSSFEEMPPSTPVVQQRLKIIRPNNSLFQQAMHYRTFRPTDMSRKYTHAMWMKISQM